MVGGHGERLEKMGKGRIMRHPVEWIAGGSAVWFTLAAILVSAVVAVGLARIISGQRNGRRKAGTRRRRPARCALPI